VKGKCRYCQRPISWQYPLVEITTGIIFILIFNFYFLIFNQLPSVSEGEEEIYLFAFNFKTFIELIYLLVISSFLIIIFVYDLKHYIIPDKIIYPAIAIVLIFNFQFFPPIAGSRFGGTIFNSSILSGLGAAAFFFLLWLISRGQWMGFGDVKLSFFMGLFLSWPNILAALFSAFFIGAIIGIGLIIAGKKTLKSQVPFGPFLVIGTFIALFWGQNLINWYINLIV
jgi:prepilin signal peptidase PulO-like enzyme (type II secretory pathway)